MDQQDSSFITPRVESVSISLGLPNHTFNDLLIHKTHKETLKGFKIFTRWLVICSRGWRQMIRNASRG